MNITLIFAVAFVSYILGGLSAAAVLALARASSKEAPLPELDREEVEP